jgi:hypothetical protein
VRLVLVPASVAAIGVAMAAPACARSRADRGAHGTGDADALVAPVGRSPLDRLHGTACASATSAPAGASDGIECAEYGSALEAFEDALTVAGAPRVLGLGEVHAPAGATVPSAAKRFTTDLLPALAGRASDLLLELMMPPHGCEDAVAEVRRDQAPVTEQHAATDQDEYVAMGNRARALGVVPDMLRPTCADMDAIKHAGDDLIDVSLTTIARLAREQAARLVDRDTLSDADRDKMVVLYGGSLHNDPAPPPEAARWSYAAALSDQVHGHYAAIDLIVPEFVGQGSVWEKLPWWPRFEEERRASAAALAASDANATHPGEKTGQGRATLFRLPSAPSANFVLILPSSQSFPSPAPSP